MSRAVRRGLIATVAVAVVVGLVAAFASAAPPAITFVPPSPAEGATLTTNAVQFAFTYNRQPKATASLECDLSGPTSSSGPCDTPVSAGEQQSSSGTSYSNLASGDYTFIVALTLEDGGTASATLQFTVNAGHVYWTNAGTNTIGRASLDGTGADQSFITGASFPRGVAVDADHVYWTNGNDIGRANLDGTGVDQSFITGASTPYGVAVDAGHVYWANIGTNTIGRANLDGTSVDQSFITGASGPRGVAVG